MTDRWAIVRNGMVENVVAWDGDMDAWRPPDGAEMVLATDDAEQGGTWDGVKFIRPVVVDRPPEPDVIDVLLEKLVASKALSAKDADDVKVKKNG